MSKTVGRHIRIDEGQWNHIELIANEKGITPNQFLVELAIEALDRREWPRTEFEIRLLRSSMFTAQAIARDMIAAGRQGEVEEIRRNISAITPELPGEPTNSTPRLTTD